MRPEEHRLDWRPRHDPRSLGFPIAAELGPLPARRYITWEPGPILNQGSEGACVGHGIVDEATASPVRVQLSDAQAEAFAVYHEAQKLDEYPGEAYTGTSVLAGAKVAVARGWWAGYSWCFGIDDVIDTVCNHGPVVLGIPWYVGMYHPYPSATLLVAGAKVGGHCLLATGYDPASETVQLTNSWGISWGSDGQAWIAQDDLAGLLDDNGEACTPTQRRLGPDAGDMRS